MDKSVIKMLLFVVLFFGILLTIKTVRKNNYIKYVCNNVDKIEYVSYNVRYETLFNDTTYVYKLVDTANSYNFFEFKFKERLCECYVIAHIQDRRFNYLLHSNLKHTFKISDLKNPTDSTIINELKGIKVIYQSTMQ